MLLLSQVTIEAEDKKTALIRPFAFLRDLPSAWRVIAPLNA